MERIRGALFGVARVLKKPHVLPILTAFAVGILLVTRGLEGLIFIAVLPLVMYVTKLRDHNRKTVLWVFYTTGVIICGFANYFLFEVSPSNWTMELSGAVRFLAPFVSWLLICAFCSLSFLLLGYALYAVRNNRYRLALLPFAFACAELIRSYLYAVMAYGPHGSLSPNFNWGSLAVIASGTPLVYASRVVGFFGLTVLVLLGSVALYMLLQKQYSRAALMVLGVLLIAGVGRALQPKSTVADTLKIKVVGLASDQDLTSWPQSEWPEQGTDLLVLPEYSEFTSNEQYRQILARLSDKGMAITTVREGRSPRATNRLIILNRQGEVVSAQDKSFLIPTGETLPYSLRAVFKLTGNTDLIRDFDYIQQLKTGDHHETVYSNGSFSVGALACSGVSALSEYSRLSKEGADVLVNSASLSFLLPDSRYHVYARNMARFQSASTGKPFVQASRSGDSYTFD